MSVEPVKINVIEKKYKQNISTEAYEKFTFMNLKHFIKETNNHENSAKKNADVPKLKYLFKMVYVLQSLVKRDSNKNQLEVFQSSMKLCLIGGQVLGVFPMAKITEKDIPKARYSILSWRYLLCFLLLLGQIIGFSLTFYRLIVNNVSLTNFGYVLFFLTNGITLILFIRLSSKWHYLVKLVATSDLNGYLDPYIKIKCDCATVIVLGFAFIEHVLSILSKFYNFHNCFSIATNTTVYESLTIDTYSWIFDHDVPYTFGFGLFLQFFTLVVTMIWSYPHLFIICISMYLTSLLDLLNENITSREGQHLPASYWRALREDYNRATRLVRSFDDAINSIIFVSIGSNLYFVCSQLYFLFGRGLSVVNIRSKCPNEPNGLFYGFENYIYITFSLIFLISRTFVVLFIPAKIHTASLVAAPSLYNVPSSSYCTEVQRFLEQIHGDTVALTGLNFFYVTKELVLSVIGTLVTYELVLLQLNTGENTNSTS